MPIVTAPREPANVPALALPVAQAASPLGVSENHFRRDVLPVRSIKVGNVRIVPVIELERLVPPRSGQLPLQLPGAAVKNATTASRCHQSLHARYAQTTLLANAASGSSKTRDRRSSVPAPVSESSLSHPVSEPARAHGERYGRGSGSRSEDDRAGHDLP
jgi:hypothetical protein